MEMYHVIKKSIAEVDWKIYSGHLYDPQDRTKYISHIDKCVSAICIYDAIFKPKTNADADAETDGKAKLKYPKKKYITCF